MNEFNNNPMPPKMVSRIQNFLYPITPVEDIQRQLQECNFKKQFRALVIFSLATDTMTVTVTSRRLSFFDKLSSFGR